VWTVREVTGNARFRVGETLQITTTQVLYNGLPVATGTFSTSTTKLTFIPSTYTDEHWELVGSTTRSSKFFLYGLTRVRTQPDAAGAWVCDPQDDP
jgi:hypothetical protein